MPLASVIVFRPPGNCAGVDGGICLISPFAPVLDCTSLSFVSNVVIFESPVDQFDAVFCKVRNTSRIERD